MGIEEHLETAVLGETAEQVNFTSLQEQRACFDSMAAQARRDIKILIHDFSNDLLTRNDILASFSSFCRISRFSLIKILVNDTDHAMMKASQLIELARRHSSSISMKKLSSEHRDQTENFFIGDQIGIIYQPNYLVPAGYVDFKSAQAKQKAKWFDDIFERSQLEPYFRQFHL